MSSPLAARWLRSTTGAVVAACALASAPASATAATAAPASGDTTQAGIQALLSRAATTRKGGDIPGAVRQMEQALALAERTARPDSLEVAAVLEAIGLAWTEAGDAARAAPVFNRVLRLRERAGGGAESSLVVPLSSRGYCRQLQGDFAGARDDFERALGILDRSAQPNLEQQSNVLNGYGLLLRDLGEYDRAKDLLQRSLLLAKQAYGPTHPNVSGTLTNLGGLEYMIGEWEPALRCFEESLRIDEATLGAEHPYIASSANNVGAILHALGRDREALPQFERSLHIVEHSLGADDPAAGRALVNMGSAQRALGDVAAARASFDRGLPLLEKDGAATAPEVAIALGDRARLLVDVGELDAARASLERSLAMRQELYGPEHPEVAAALHDLGNVLAASGDMAGARQDLERALAVREAALGPAHPDVGTTLQDLAAVELEQHDWGAASRAALRAESIGRDHLRTLARGLSEREALAYAGVRPAGSSLALAAALGARQDQQPDEPLARAAWDAVIRSRCLVLDEMAFRRQAAAAPRNRKLAAQADSLRQARARLAAMVARPVADAGDPAGAAAKRLAQIDTLARAKEALERRVAHSIASVRRQVMADTTGFASVARALPDDAALVAYAPARAQRGRAVECALVLAPHAAKVIAVPLGPRATIDALVAAWREAVLGGNVPAGPLRANAERAADAAGQRLRAAIWDPLAAHTAGAARVFVVPEGSLQWVNIPALPDGQGRYLIESGPLVHVLTAERDLLEDLDQPAGARVDATPPRGLLAVGGPDFDAEPSRVAAPHGGGAGGGTSEGDDPDGALGSIYRGVRSSCQSLQDLRFARLPLAGREAEEVASIYRRARRQSVEVLEGDHASEERFKSAAHARAVLHLATHGFYLERSCAARDSAGPGRADWTVVSSGSAPATAAVAAEALENPLLLSGLAFAGANRRAQPNPGQDDGVLTAEEIAALDLLGTEWVVLSACDTGMGLAAAGEGVLGLRRAFRTAGARTLILSLWPVEDAAARAWMSDLYRERFERHADTASAVRAASLAALRRERAATGSAHPFGWGGFLAAGGWR